MSVADDDHLPSSGLSAEVPLLHKRKELLVWLRVGPLDVCISFNTVMRAMLG